MGVQGEVKVSNETESNQANSKMTKAEVKRLSNEELIKMREKSIGHTKEFQTYMNCNFSYTYFMNIFNERGLGKEKSAKDRTEWIQMRRPKGEVSRQTYKVPKDVAAEWKSFNEDFPYNSVIIGTAMKRFMDDYRNGRVKFIYTNDERNN